jgi:hypothetical protein
MEKSILYSIFAVNLDEIKIVHKKALQNYVLFLGIHFKLFMSKTKNKY